MLFIEMPVPGTTTPDPEPSEHESDGGVALRVDDGDVRGHRRRVDEAPGEPAAVELRREELVAHRVLLAHRLDHVARAKPPRRSSCCRPYAISTPPDEGGGFDANRGR